MERLNAGEIVIGDGGFVFALEKRGYVKAGPWTPEASVTHPEAGMVDCFRFNPNLNSHYGNMIFISPTAAQGVPQGRSQCHAGFHILRQR